MEQGIGDQPKDNLQKVTKGLLLGLVDKDIIYSQEISLRQDDEREINPQDWLAPGMSQ